MKDITSPYSNIEAQYMDRSYRRTINTKVFIVLLTGVYLFSLTGNSFVVNTILLLSLYSFLDLILSLSKGLPIKEITGFLMVVQLLLTPYLDYSMLKPKGISFMAVSQEKYFYYALPAVFAFIIGMKIKLKKNADNIIQNINKGDKSKNSKIGIALIVIGYLFFILQKTFNLAGYEFIFVVLALFRFVGLFYLWFSNNKYTVVYMLLVLIPTTISTIQGSVFIDLVIWFFFIYAFAAIKYKVKIRTTITIVAASLFLLLILQSVKIRYRAVEWKSVNTLKTSTGIDLFADLFTSSLQTINEKSLFKMKANLIIRMNQGWIVSHVLKKDVPNSVTEQKTFLSDELVGIILPRFIYEDKAIVGDNKKFRYLTGINLNKSVSMNVGILGDGYGNFGFLGGILFCFLFGLFLNLAINVCLKISNRTYSILFWMPLIFFYAMRAGNEFYIITNWIVKSGIIVMFYFYISKRIFRKSI